MVARWVHLGLERCAGLDALAAFRLPLRVHGSPARAVGRALDALARLGADDGSLRWQVAWRRHGYAIADCILHEARPRADHGELLPLHPVFELVDRRLHEPLSVTELAASVHLSEGRFHAVFKRAMGTTPRAWLQRVRLKRAAHELLHTDDGIQAVAARCGFQSPFHFSRAFKAWSGQAPQPWRAQQRAGLL